MNFKTIKPWLAVSFLLLICFFLYKPGLTGGFLLDDENTLSKLDLVNDNISFDSVWSYLAASEAATLKRPVSMLSFLLDAQNWPAEAYSFKRTNLIIHLLNGLLLYVFLYRLFSSHKKYKESAVLISFIASGFWILSPFLLSTTFYISQRMSMLPVLFGIIGFNIYFYLRKKVEKRPDKYTFSLLTVIYGTVLLAIFSKENAILLIFLFPLFEIFICQNWLHLTPLSLRKKIWLFALPLIGTVIIIMYMMTQTIFAYDFRLFTITERFLTQFRALSSYLYYLFIPDYFTEGVFTDGFKFSKGFLSPISTLFSVIFVSGLLLSAWFLKHRFTWYSFAVFFFFIAHAIESSIFPLELYFEHRNYLPALFLYVPAALVLSHLVRLSKIYYLVVVALLGLFSMHLYFRANLWGNEHFLYQQSIEKFPESNRARIFYAGLHEQNGLPIDAIEILEAGYEYSNKLELRLDAAYLKCKVKDLSNKDMENLIQHFKIAKFTKEDIKVFELFMEELISNSCNNESLVAYIKPLINALESNLLPRTGYGRPLVYYFNAKYQLFIINDPIKAQNLYKKAFKVNHDYVTIIMGIKDLIKNKALTEASDLTNLALTMYESDFKYKIDWRGYLDVLLAYEKIIQNKLDES